MLLATAASRMRSILSLATALLAILTTAGCGTLSGPGSASFASVTIENHTEQEINAAASQVFAADGWRGGVSSPGQMLFEKEASRGTTFMREGLVATHEGAQSINRVRAQVVRLAENKYRLQCKAYVVTGGSDPFFQEETALSNMRSAPYQMLLNQVKQQLP